MNAFMLGLHNVLRWLVILVGIVALLRSIRGVIGNAAWTRRESLSLSAYAQTISLQMLVGLFVYFVLSPVGVRALGDMRTAMRDAEIRFFAVEHPLVMLLAVALAHIAVARTRKATTDAARYRSAAILLTLSLLLVLARMPWARPLIPSF
jgi:hypothetical protein